uniref:Uncharacterized protein n=1 Tax=Anguilla anguilla TaxID=7936 RepID=A0A0E9QFQ6_ANGAN
MPLFTFVNNFHTPLIYLSVTRVCVCAPRGQ